MEGWKEDQASSWRHFGRLENLVSFAPIFEPISIVTLETEGRGPCKRLPDPSRASSKFGMQLQQGFSSTCLHWFVNDEGPPGQKCLDTAVDAARHPPVSITSRLFSRFDSGRYFVYSTKSTTQLKPRFCPIANRHDPPKLKGAEQPTHYGAGPSPSTVPPHSHLHMLDSESPRWIDVRLTRGKDLDYLPWPS
jgi:hypothetical protein